MNGTCGYRTVWYMPPAVDTDLLCRVVEPSSVILHNKHLCKIWIVWYLTFKPCLACDTNVNRIFIAGDYPRLPHNIWRGRSNTYKALPGQRSHYDYTRREHPWDPPSSDKLPGKRFITTYRRHPLPSAKWRLGQCNHCTAMVGRVGGSISTYTGQVKRCLVDWIPH